MKLIDELKRCAFPSEATDVLSCLMMRCFMKPVAIVGALGLSILFLAFVVTCTGKAPPTNLAASPYASPSPGLPSSNASLPLRTLRDIPLTGGATRFDYQSFDVTSGRLYIAHLGDGTLAIFDSTKETVVGDV